MQFEEKEMVFRRYYEVGAGVSHPYNDLQIKPAAEIIKDFSETSKQQLTSSEAKKAKRKNRDLCSLFFCMETGCSCSFENKDDYEAHILRGDHKGVQTASTMDCVKEMFVEKMKSLSDARSSMSASSSVETVSTAPNQLMKLFQTEGWAIPKRSNFRFSFEQKTILYKCFKDGEKTGNKVSPEEADAMIRKKLTRKDFLDPLQIKGLFGRWSKQLREGKLRPPKQSKKEKARAENVHDSDEEKESGDEEESGTDGDEEEADTDDEEATEYCNLLKNSVASSQWEEKDWVVVIYNKKMFPGQIIDVIDGEFKFKVDCMHECFPGEGRNCFRWPHPRDDKTSYDANEILCEIKQPEKPTNSRGAIKLADDDFENAKKLFVIK